MKLDDLRSYMVERRKRLGLTQAAVALRMGADQAAVSKLESGATKEITVDHIARWASALGLVASVQFRERVVVPVAFELDAAPETQEDA
ncbi:helix-turn-helix domain-containing protein [Actinoplanes teichomyceticus]|uniref:Helix-turn-helix protein n=1 Tax=Actinoplanes teichomyceticus TaxID=1867 RepID=A0A561WAU3_ACTTI|nr:helix-turn-helix transcriptional regulator [Actinoplanes teichomyceticus]TWG20987.1 helix-turn-helix protein [Actinoplanes teichomyceticus]GIF14806.1 hypothetical protein Ate01nite_48380 [Actinoplanes teichomyceticus]